MRRRWLSVAVVAAFTVVLLSYLAYTQRIAEELRRDAAAFSRIYFEVVRAAVTPGGMTPAGELALLEELYDLTVPVVLTDLEGRPTDARNLPFEAQPGDPDARARLREYVAVLDQRNPPLVDSAQNLVVHYGEPLFLRRLKWIPWLQAALLLGVVGAGAWMIRTSFRGERERIWSAMARESAHQMGTPLSSLAGWLEVASTSLPAEATRTGDVDLLSEMEADVQRLRKVSRRFELIGRAPALRPVDLSEIVRRLGRYFRARLPSLGSSVELELRLPESGPIVRGNETLLEWAFENVIKNSVDSLAGRRGRITVEYAGVEEGRAVLRVSDDGPGVSPHLRDRIFDVGVTTKEGGWGVGLSLARRIVVDVHDGGIELEPAERGAIFRIALPLGGGEGDERAPEGTTA